MVSLPFPHHRSLYMFIPYICADKYAMCNRPVSQCQEVFLLCEFAIIFFSCMETKQYFSFLFFFKRKFRIRAAQIPEDVELLFHKYSENGTMTVDQLHRFLVENQQEGNATCRDDAQNIFNSLKHLYFFHRSGLHLEAFFQYLFSDNNLPLPNKVHHDMTQPLSHYFLYTGHNSYLTGNQISSASKVDPIIKALKKGVRVIELDLWPNADKDDVEVRHGGTLTSPVELIKCLRAIKDYAFYASEYPVIITFEDHLTHALQQKVAKMVIRTFGRMLFYPTSENFEEFPSPESLKKRILISTKLPKEYLETQDSNVQEKKSADARPAKHEKKTVFRTQFSSKPVEDIKKVRSILSYFLGEKDVQAEIQGEEEELQDEVPEYKRLIAIHAGKKRGGLVESLNTHGDRALRLSLNEQQLEEAARSHGTDIIRFTKKNLLRVYPKGLRINSSNYDPMVGWMHGAQMVAFNMQGYGKYLRIMQGMFRGNGGCGYVKKPSFLLNTGSQNGIFDPYATLPVKIILKIKVYMGDGWHLDFHHRHFDHFSPPDFFVVLKIAGVPVDKLKKQTKVIEDQWVPVWIEEFMFPLTVPELALLRIEVKEYDTSGSHDFGGQTCLPVSELKTGIRSVPLHDRKGERYKSVKLLMGFDFIIPC